MRAEQRQWVRALQFLILAAAIGAACSAGFARQSKKQPKPTEAQAALGEPYAKAALIALKTIAADETVPHMENGEPTGEKDTIAAIAAAGALGQTPAEKSATNALRAIYRDKLLDNDRRNTKKMNYESDSGLEDEGTREMTAQQEMLSDTELIEMDQKEKACFDAVEAMVGSRSWALPPACPAWAPDLKSLPKNK
jgi:hypothetical protein